MKEHPVTLNRIRDHLMSAQFCGQMLYQLSYHRCCALFWDVSFGISRRDLTQSGSLIEKQVVLSIFVGGWHLVSLPDSKTMPSS